MRKRIPLLALVAIAFAGRAAGFEAGLHPGSSYCASGYGMGNAVVSLPAHESNVWTNPAGLAYTDGYLFSLAPHDEVSGVIEDWRERVAVANGLRGFGGVFGGAIILRQRQDAAFRLSDERIVPADIDEPALLVGYGRRIGEKYAIGATLFGYQHRSDLDPLDGDATVGATAGLMRVWEHTHRNGVPVEYRCGLAAAGLGPSFHVGETTTDLPLSIRGGVSALWRKDGGTSALVAGDLFWLPRDLKGVEEAPDTRIGGGLGGELKLSGVVAVRAGYVWDADSDRRDATYGFGIGNELYGPVGGMIEYAHAPGTGDFADHIGIRVYYKPEQK